MKDVKFSMNGTKAQVQDPWEPLFLRHVIARLALHRSLNRLSLLPKVGGIQNGYRLGTVTEEIRREKTHKCVCVCVCVCACVSCLSVIVCLCVGVTSATPAL